MKYIFLFALGITIIAAIVTFVIPAMLGIDITPSKGRFPNGTAIPNDWLECETDADCFAGECCHPAFCVNAAGRPDCQGVGCTEECRGDTIDCGCGSCVCINGKCSVEWTKDNDLCSGGQ
jgi:hypothetical protein